MSGAANLAPPAHPAPAPRRELLRLALWSDGLLVVELDDEVAPLEADEVDRVMGFFARRVASCASVAEV